MNMEDPSLIDFSKHPESDVCFIYNHNEQIRLFKVRDQQFQWKLKWKQQNKLTVTDFANITSLIHEWTGNCQNNKPLQNDPRSCETMEALENSVNRIESNDNVIIQVVERSQERMALIAEGGRSSRNQIKTDEESDWDEPFLCLSKKKWCIIIALSIGAIAVALLAKYIWDKV
jgi:hypothetical protein